MRATREELCLFHYPDLTHKGAWKGFLQRRVLTNLQKSKYKCLTHVFRPRVEYFDQVTFSTSNLTSPFICCKDSPLYLAHLVSAYLNSLPWTPTEIQLLDLSQSKILMFPLNMVLIHRSLSQQSSTGATLWKSSSMFLCLSFIFWNPRP